MADIGRIGKLEGSNLPRLLIQSYLEKKSAIIDFQQDDVRKSLHLEKGTIIFARSNQKSDRLGNFLVNNNFISQDDLKKAANILVKTGNRLGRILVEMKLISPRDLFVSVRKQIADIALSLFDWSSGQFRVHDDLKPPEERIVLEMSTPELVLLGARRHISDDYDWQSLFGDNDILTIFEDGFFDKLPFEEDEQSIIKIVQDPVSVNEIQRKSTLDEHVTGVILSRLYYLGYVVTKKVKSELSSPISTDMWHWPPDLETQFQQYNKAFRFIFRYAKIEAGDNLFNELFTTFEDVKLSCDPIFNDVTPDENGTLELDSLKQNATLIPPEQRMSRLIYSLNEYLYALILSIQMNMRDIQYQQVMKEIRSVLD